MKGEIVCKSTPYVYHILLWIREYLSLHKLKECRRRKKRNGNKRTKWMIHIRESLIALQLLFRFIWNRLNTRSGFWWICSVSVSVKTVILLLHVSSATHYFFSILLAVSKMNIVYNNGYSKYSISFRFMFYVSRGNCCQCFCFSWIDVNTLFIFYYIDEHWHYFQ